MDTGQSGLTGPSGVQCRLGVWREVACKFASERQNVLASVTTSLPPPLPPVGHHCPRDISTTDIKQ